MDEAPDYKTPGNREGTAIDQTDESGWLVRISKGDQLAFAALYNAWRDKLYSFTLRLSGSETLAEEAVQESFLKIWQRQDELAEIKHFSAYLFRTARNHLINGLKRQSKERSILADIGHPDGEGHSGNYGSVADPATVLDGKEFRIRLQRAIDNLPEQQRKVYLLSREQGWRQDRIAEHLDISVSTVKTHMTLALRTLREQFRDRYPPGTLPLILALTSLLAR